MKIDTEKLWSLEAEAAVLGSIMLAPDCLLKLLPWLSDEHFYRPEHGKIYFALAKLAVADKPIDGVTLRTQLKADGCLDEIGGVEYLGKLMDSVPGAANFEYYAGIVKERAKYRKLVKAVDKINKAATESGDVSSQIKAVQEIALQLDSTESEKRWGTLAELVPQVVKQGAAETEYYATGLRNIDSIITGIAPGELVVLAGRPGMGKSALALQAALNMAAGGLSVLFFTLEMTRAALAKRALQSHQADDLTPLKVILHEGGLTPEQQLAFVKTHKQTTGVDVMFIDYLQLMSGGHRTENRQQEITTISRKLKRMAVSENIPVVALSQLNRAVEQREHHRPRLSDLRESGSIEQDSDLVMLLSREDYYRRNADPQAATDGDTDLIIAKNRRGPTGIARLVFVDDEVKFGDRADYE